mmetsp:Transcript_22485/g.74150  ORF Transcript_22485/g.74150 Transcript_22485/m.74150 type:complete len:313 (-) Transcript_22485:249-1187(-)
MLLRPSGRAPASHQPATPEPRLSSSGPHSRELGRVRRACSPRPLRVGWLRGVVGVGPSRRGAEERRRRGGGCRARAGGCARDRPAERVRSGELFRRREARREEAGGGGGDAREPRGGAARRAVGARGGLLRLVVRGRGCACARLAGPGRHPRAVRRRGPDGPGERRAAAAAPPPARVVARQPRATNASARPLARGAAEGGPRRPAARGRLVGGWRHGAPASRRRARDVRVGRRLALSLRGGHRERLAAAVLVLAPRRLLDDVAPARGGRCKATKGGRQRRQGGRQGQQRQGSTLAEAASPLRRTTGLAASRG